jgi:hypothetical protein
VFVKERSDYAQVVLEARLRAHIKALAQGIKDIKNG